MFIQLFDVFFHDIAENVKRAKMFDVEFFIVSDFVWCFVFQNETWIDVFQINYNITNFVL